MSACFNDPSGDLLTYVAVSSNPGVAAASAVGSMVTITAETPGNVSVTVTATDPGGMKGQQAFQILVPNRPPLARSTIPAQTIESGDKGAIDLSPHFDDPNGDPLTYTASASDPRVATLAVRSNVLEIVGGVRGTTDVTVTARDPEGLTASQQTVNAGGTVALDVSAYFGDADGDALTYEALSSDPATVAVAVHGDAVQISGVARGEATVAVVATDPGGLHARSSFLVDVIGREAGQFHIELVFATPMSSTHEAAFRDAAERWMAILADTKLPDVTVNGTVDCAGEYAQSVETIDDLIIVAAVVEIDGPDKVLGRARFCRMHDGSHLPWLGMMEFDVADLDLIERTGILKPVILHEMAVEAFDQAGGESYTDGGKVPVANKGTRPGSDDRALAQIRVRHGTHEPLHQPRVQSAQRHLDPGVGRPRLHGRRQLGRPLPPAQCRLWNRCWRNPSTWGTTTSSVPSWSRTRAGDPCG